jgi:hypothetical protein
MTALSKLIFKITIVILKINRLIRVYTRVFNNYKFDINRLTSFGRVYKKLPVNNLDNILNNKIQIFGKEVSLDNIDSIWHKDPFSRVEYKKFNLYFSRPKNKNNDDIKSTWEVARLNFILPIVMEINNSAQLRHIEALKTIIFSFLSNDYLFFGIHWINPMEVSIRSINICFAYAELHKYLSVKEKKKIEGYLYASMHYIFIFKEKNAFSNNHYMSNLLALSVLSNFFNDAKIKKFSKEEFKYEVVRQVYHDGTVFEGSTYYHRLTLEIVFYFVLFETKIQSLNRGGVSYKESLKFFPKEVIQRLYKMFLFIKYSIKENSELPIVGDNDSGQLLKFFDKEVLDVGYLLHLGSAFFEKNLFNNEKKRPNHPLVNLINGSPKHRQSLIKKNYIKFYKNSGWLVCKYKDVHLFISAGPNGQGGKGGHAHNDKTSYTLSLKLEDIVLESGSQSYTSNPKIRRKDRSNLSHNVMSILDSKGMVVEQSNLDQGDFKLIEKCYASILSYSSSRSKIEIACAHNCFQDVTKIRHKRVFILDKIRMKLTIEDVNYNKHRVVNNVIVSKRCPDRLGADSDWSVKNFTHSKIYLTSEKCKRMQIEGNKYEINVS